MMSLPLRVACILIAGFLIVLVITYIYKLNTRKVFWGVGLTIIIGILILLGFGILNPSWGTETGVAIIVGISTAIGCATALIYGAEDLHQKKIIKGKGKIESKPNAEQEIAVVKLPTRLDTEVARKVFSRAIDAGYIIVEGDHYVWTETKVLLAYMCGRIYCEDYPEKTRYDEKMFWGPGKIDLFPDADLNTLFNQTDLTQSRHNRKGKPAPTGHEKIDKLFE